MVFFHTYECLQTVREDLLNSRRTMASKDRPSVLMTHDNTSWSDCLDHPEGKIFKLCLRHQKLSEKCRWDMQKKDRHGIQGILCAYGVYGGASMYTAPKISGNPLSLSLCASLCGVVELKVGS